MTDLHTHILPGMDDGAADAAMSLQMLRQERLQGVDTVVLTPHFYPERESAARFLARRAAAWERLQTAIAELPEEERQTVPRLLLGAEVAFLPGLGSEVRQLCIGNTDFMLLEMPFFRWSGQLIRQLYDLVGQTGVTPVLAHIDRYFSCQKREHLQDLLSMGLPTQLGTELLLGGFSAKRQGMKLLKTNAAHFVASDCHDPVHRPPNLGKAMAVVRSKLGAEACIAMQAYTKELLEEF